MPTLAELAPRYLEHVHRYKRAPEIDERYFRLHLLPIVTLLLLTGCRKRALLDAKWDHLDLERKNWRIPMSKSGKARYVPLSDEALKVLDFCRFSIVDDVEVPCALIEEGVDGGTRKVSVRIIEGLVCAL